MQLISDIDLRQHGPGRKEGRKFLLELHGVTWSFYVNHTVQIFQCPWFQQCPPPSFHPFAFQLPSLISLPPICVVLIDEHTHSHHISCPCVCVCVLRSVVLRYAPPTYRICIHMYKTDLSFRFMLYDSTNSPSHYGLIQHRESKVSVHNTVGWFRAWMLLVALLSDCFIWNSCICAFFFFVIILSYSL